MSPQPEPFADLMRWAQARFMDGDDFGLIVLHAVREAYNRGRRDAAGATDPFAHEPTPTQDAAHPSERPTMLPPRGPTGTIPSMPAPRMPKGVK